jgi:hypothetical protein
MTSESSPAAYYCQTNQFQTFKSPKKTAAVIFLIAMAAAVASNFIG